MSSYMLRTLEIEGKSFRQCGDLRLFLNRLNKSVSHTYIVQLVNETCIIYTNYLLQVLAKLPAVDNRFMIRARMFCI